MCRAAWCIWNGAHRIMNVGHRVIGYDKVSEWLALEHCVPTVRVAEARRVAEALADVAAASGAFPLGAAAALQPSEMLGYPMSTERYDWFLESFAG